jgi:hypothetical protein
MYSLGNDTGYLFVQNLGVRHHNEIVGEFINQARFELEFIIF